MIRYNPLIESNNDLFILSTGRYKFPVYKNPNKEQFNILLDRYYSEYPNAPKGNVKIRSTYDKQGNEYSWMAGDSDHYTVEEYLMKVKKIETNQNWG